MSTAKKIAFSALTFFLFLVLFEAALGLAPTLLGMTQRGDYDWLEEGATTIICIGDSVTYGHGVSSEESYPARLEQLLKAGGGESIRVMNRGVTGWNQAGSPNFLRKETRLIGQVHKKGGRPVVLYLGGHNDVMGAGWEQWTAGGSGNKERSYRLPRFLRILNWGLKTASSGSAEKGDEDTAAMLRKNIVSFADAAEQSGGQLYLLTYMIPGKPEGLEPETAKRVATCREKQRAGNQMLRQLAAEKGLPMIDLENTVPAPSVFDSQWFIDHIHPTPKGHREIAEAALKHLAAYGELPVSMAAP
jgi:lysophospholipase L1-like esterase